MKKITIHTLRCESTEDWTGADTCRLEISVDGGREAVFRKNLNGGDRWRLNKTFNFNRSVKIQLWDEDTEGDDFLGDAEIRTITRGRAIVDFEGDASYRLSYSVAHAADTEQPNRITMSFRQMAKRMDPLYPPARMRGENAHDGRNVMNCSKEDKKGLWPMHRGMDDGQKPSLRALAERHTHRDTTLNRFLFYNTYLLDLVADILPTRADEIGKEIERNYDIAGLTEVFDAEDLYRIREQVSGEYRDATGPDSDWPSFPYSGGLVTFARPRIVVSKHFAFDENGSSVSADDWTPYIAVDPWANKGVLLTVIDIGVGKIDLYTTHLYSGEESDEAYTYDIRLKQIDELLGFVRSNRNPEHVTIVAGDTNIRAGKEEYYNDLVHRMARYNLQDIWPIRGGRHGTTMYAVTDNPSKRCVIAEQSGREYFCDDYAGDEDDYAGGDRDYDRVDYIFIEEPTEAHTFNLDVTRVRRKSGWRGWRSDSGSWDRDRYGNPIDGTIFLEPQYMSDHMGLATGLIASPK